MIKKFIRKNRGFTLIELLIVIALLGALAVGLLAAVDPFEQLKKGTDTSRRNTVAEFYNAAIRYYAINSQFPWTSGSPPSGNAMTSAVVSGAIQTLEDSGELKENFGQLAGGDSALMKMFVTSVTTAGSETVAVCFLPESKSFKKEKNTVYNNSAGTQSGCPATGTCYWCMK